MERPKDQIIRTGRAAAPAPGRRPRLVAAACAALVAVPLAVVAVAATTAQARPDGSLTRDTRTVGTERADGGPGAAPAVNWALSGTASATTAESGKPAANAIDGDAGTDWCTSGYTGTLTVDLGQVRSLADLGLTLDAASPSASATIELASTAGRLAAGARAARRRARPGPPAVLPAAVRQPGQVRRGDRLQRHRGRRVRGRVPGVRARRRRGRHGPRHRPVLHPAGTRRGRQVQLRRQARHPGDDHPRRGRELRPDPALGQPAARLQRPDQRPRAGPAGARGRDEDLPGHHVLGLLGRPAAPGHPGRVGGPGPRPSSPPRSGPTPSRSSRRSPGRARRWT